MTTNDRYYGAIIPSILNVISLQGYLIINCIIGGQTLASASSHLDATTGVIITGLISLAVSFLLPILDTLTTVDDCRATGHLLRLSIPTLVS